MDVLTVASQLLAPYKYNRHYFKNFAGNFA